MTLSYRLRAASSGFALCLGLTAATPAQAQPTPTTEIRLVSQPGDYIGQGQTRTLTPADGPFFPNVNPYDGTVSISFDRFGSGFWHLNFAAPHRARLVPGHYPGARRLRAFSLAPPKIEVWGESRGCNDVTGSFTVYEATYDSAGEITAFAATFEQHCEGATPALLGSVLFNSTLPPPPPPPPADFVATVQQHHAHFEWQESIVGGAASRYRVEFGLAPLTTVAALETPDARPVLDVPNVPPGRYFVRVRGLDQNGHAGAPSADYAVTVMSNGWSVLPPPRDVVASVAGGQLSMSWSAPAVATALSGYVLEVGSATGRTDLSVPLGPATTFSYAAVPPGVYVLRVRAVNPAGLGQPSLETVLRVNTTAGPPSAPSTFAAGATGATVDLGWGVPLTGLAALRYRIEVGSYAGGSNVGVFETHWLTRTMSVDAVPAGHYFLRVRALNSWGLGVATADRQIVVR